jgi:hypothetical protein
VGLFDVVADGLATLSARMPPDAAARACESVSNGLLTTMADPKPYGAIPHGQVTFASVRSIFGTLRLPGNVRRQLSGELSWRLTGANFYARQ